MQEENLTIMTPSASITLYDALPGSRVRIRRLHAQPEVSHRLRELGFCEDVVIRCIAHGYGNVVCEISNTRVGLNRHVAKGIVVTAFE